LGEFRIGTRAAAKAVADNYGNVITALLEIIYDRGKI
jgi:hypothetical protein